jgi:hypothetical protein
MWHFQIKKYFLQFTCLACNLLFMNDLVAQNSVLSQGTFYKLAIPASQRGIYKIDKNLLTQLGINTTQINPQNIQVFGNGGGILPQANQATRPFDLQENAIWVSGEDDGKFDDNDFVLFYAEGANKIYYDATKDLIRHENNFYDDNNYYFLTIGLNKGKRIENAAIPQGEGAISTTYDEIDYYEKDVTNLENGGRTWLDTRLTDFVRTQTINSSLRMEGITENSTAKLFVQAFGASRTNQLKIKVQINGKEATELSVTPYPAFDPRYANYVPKGRAVSSLTTLKVNDFWTANSTTTTVRLDFDNGQDGNAFACLDFWVLNVERKLQLYGNQTLFRSVKSLRNAVTTYQFAPNTPTTVQVWEVTTPYNATRQQINNLAFKRETNNTLREFVAFNPTANFPKPEVVGKVNTQNIKGIATPDLLIVCYPLFRQEAQRLADFRKINDKLTVAVVTTEEVYNEFSSGRKDVSAIRDFVRFLYLKDKKLKYLLLFGNASFKYKGNEDLVPTYQSVEYIDPVFNYCSDDYFALLDENEGEWAEYGFIDQAKMEIGVGRLPIRRSATEREMLREAAVMVNKLIAYSSGNSMGMWRINTVFLADNDDDKRGLFQAESNLLADNVAKQFPVVQTEKLFMDAYPTESVGSAVISPQIRQRVDRAVEKGSLIINYIGHGSESGWASERALTASSAARWRGGLNNMPLFMTATCEFGRYDGTLRTAAEYSLNNPEGGAIGMLTTSRPVYNTNNSFVNEAFWEAVYQPLPNGEMPRLGDVIRITKNNSLRGVANRNFVLLGDPSMRLAYPQQSIFFTEVFVDGKPSQQLTALSRVTIQGEIRNGGVLNTAFNGTATVVVLDKKYNVQTLGVLDAKMTFSRQDNILFQGQVSVTNGKFSCSFIVPKNIDYQNGEGKIYAYAVHNDKTTDAAGASTAITIGGSRSNVPVDNTAPTVQLFVENEQFKNNDVVPANTQLIVKLADTNGINVSNAGIGQDIVATLNGTTTFVLNSYYIADKDDFTKGSIYFPLKNLAAGKYTLQLQVWDTYNNPATATVTFFVNLPPLTVQTTASPNPFSDKIVVTVEQNRTDVAMQAEFAIYNTAGQLVWQFDEDFEFVPQTFTYEWRGQNEGGQFLENGLYIYHVVLKDLQTGEVVKSVGKLALLR